MGSHITKPSNKSMVDRLVEHNSYIRSPLVEGVFRAVDRAMYFDLEEGDGIDPYEDDPWRRGNLHLSAPCIYAKVVEALDLRSGLSFLNLGSGTGYLNTIVGLLVGPNGLNHGVELHADVVDYAYKRLQHFKQHSYAIDKYNFSEPVFIMGNCLNLNPNSQYDRIYLGAACLPDLENFMKKLIKPNGGILVMPYENHLIRYIRIAESEWKSEKLMDVNFTLMIRQGDNESMIDMPLAQAKSLKELCRINIRQQLRDKTNLLNPNLLHSDNISSRRMRKARAERRMLMREERSSKSKNRNFFNDRRRGSRNSDNSQSKRGTPKGNGGIDFRNGGCGCRRLVEEIDHDKPVAMPSSSESLLPSTSSASARTRVMTRSASRRLEGLVANPPPYTPEDPPSISRPKQSNSSREISPNKYQLATSSSGSDDSDDDDGQIQNSARTSTSTSNNDGNSYEANSSNSIGHQDGSSNCARTRPFVYTARNPSRSSLYVPSGYRTAPSLNRSIGRRPPALLPFHRRMARIIDPPSSSSSSPSSSSSSESSDDLNDLDEYDYIGRRVVLDWPGFLRIHNDEDPADLDIPDNDSHSTDSTLSSHNADLILGDNDSIASEMSSWDSFYDSFSNNNCLVDFDEFSSFMNSDNDDDDDDDDGTRHQDSIEIGRATLSFASASANVTSQPSTSGRCQTRASKLKDYHAESKGVPATAITKPSNTNIVPSNKNSDVRRKAGDQEPVARRLRSKRAIPTTFDTGLTENAEISEETQSPMSLDRPVPSCSRAELQRDSCHESKCPTHLRSRRLNPLTSSAASCNCHTAKSSGGRSKVSGEQDETNRNQNLPSLSNHHHHSNTTDGNHSPMLLPPEPASVDMLGNQGQGLFTGRVLIATALGTTLSLAAHHYRHHHHHNQAPPGGRNGSLQLFGRRTLDNVPQTRYGHQCPAQQQSSLDRKRKRHSSSESGSDRSDASSSSNHRAQRSGRFRRRCGCSRHLVQQSTESPSATLQTRDGRATNATSKSAYGSTICSNCESIDQQSLSPSSSPPPPSSANNKQQARQVATKANDPSSTQTGSHSNIPNLTVRGPRANRNSLTDNNGNQRGDSMNYRSGRCHNLSANSSSSHHHHHHHQQHRHHHRHHHNHGSHQSCPRPLKVSNKRSRDIDQQNDSRGEKKQRKRDRRRENECVRYHNHLSCYIRQLPLPRVLHGYLNYERNLATDDQ